MAWSDAARKAAAEARKRKPKYKYDRLMQKKSERRSLSKAVRTRKNAKARMRYFSMRNDPGRGF